MVTVLGRIARMPPALWTAAVAFGSEKWASRNRSAAWDTVEPARETFDATGAP